MAFTIGIFANLYLYSHRARVCLSRQMSRQMSRQILKPLKLILGVKSKVGPLYIKVVSTLTGHFLEKVFLTLGPPPQKISKPRVF